MNAKTYIQCSRCLGSGIFHGVNEVTHEPIIEDPCTSCNGVGYSETGKIDITAITDNLAVCQKMLKIIMKKLEIKEIDSIEIKEEE